MNSINTEYVHEHPLYLYKYRSGSQRDIETLSRNKIFIPDLHNLNDIYENDFEFEIEIALKHTNIFYPHVMKNQFGDPIMAPIMLSRILENNELEEHRVRIKKAMCIVREGIFKMGVYSLSHICKNHLMWAHYSDSYKGYCIEYKIPPANKCIGKSPRPLPVEYVGSPPKIEWSLINHYSDLMLQYYMIGHKPEFWKYELEYRAVFPNGQKEFDIPYDIESIIFGPDSSLDLQETIKKIFGHKINYKQVKKSVSSYDLDIIILSN